RLPPLERLQQTRVLERLSERQARAILPKPRWLPALLACGAAVAMVALVLSMPTRAPMEQRAPAPVAQAPAPVQSLEAEVRITPPTYTGLPARTQSTLDLVAEEGAGIHWSFRFTVQPTTARLHFVDGTELPLQQTDDTWTAEHTATAST